MADKNIILAHIDTCSGDVIYSLAPYKNMLLTIGIEGTPDIVNQLNKQAFCVEPIGIDTFIRMTGAQRVAHYQAALAAVCAPVLGEKVINIENDIQSLVEVIDGQ